MIDSLDKVLFYELVAPGEAADIAVATARRNIERTRAARDEPAVMRRIQDVWAVALDVWETDEGAVDFLFRRHAMLGDHRPIDAILDSDEGAVSVKDILGRLRYGSAA